jgi:hypothetical protein
VRRLPDPLRFELVTESLVERAAVARAARIVLPVGADEEERMVDLGAGRQIDAAEVFVALELGAGDLGLAESAVKARRRGAARRSGRLTNRRRPCGTDETCSRRCCLTWSVSPLPGSASRVHRPRYSMRNQLSILLAVAASGSSFSRERSAQKGLLLAWLSIPSGRPVISDGVACGACAS